MKKLILILAALLAASVLLVSCSDGEENVTPNNQEENVQNETPETPDEPEVPDAPDAPTATGLQAVADAIYEKSPVLFMAGSVPAEMVNAESMPYYTGLADDSQVDEVLVSESMMGSQAYSLVLVTVKDGEDVNAVADAMMNGIDTGKWICVRADQIRTVASGNTVMLIMLDSQLDLNVDTFVSAFEEVVGAVEYEAKKQ